MQIKCMNCQSNSVRNERMLDLTVGIPGDVRTLQEALFRFTATEVLDGENRYKCSRFVFFSTVIFLMIIKPLRAILVPCR